jgi:hypothetical protein
MDRLENDLTCPLSLDFLEDPVTVPCCGRSFSRRELKSHLDTNETCPLCRQNIKSGFPTFDANTAARNVLLSSLVESFKAAARPGSVPGPVAASAPPVDLSDVAPIVSVLAEANDAAARDRPEWTCHLTQVTNALGEPLPVGHMTLNASWDSFEPQKSLLVFVMDKSGSMAGRAFGTSCAASIVGETLVLMACFPSQNK